MSTPAIILIVDDEQQNRDLLAAVLRPFGHQLLFAADGVEGLESAREFRPDLILLDVMMPLLDGFEVCQQLRADPTLAEIPVILITALDDRESRLRGLEAGADDFLTKPIDRIEIRTRVQTITRLNRYRRVVVEREKFEHIAELASDGYAQVAADGCLLYANRQARIYLGLPKDGALPAESWVELLRRQYRFDQPPADTSAAGIVLPLHVVRPDTDTQPAQWLQVERLAVPSERGGQLLRFMEVTERLGHQRDLWRFHSRLSHKLRTPLNGLLGCLELLADGTGSMAGEDFAEVTTMASGCAKRLNGEIEDMLGYLGASLLCGSGAPATAVALATLAETVARELELTGVTLEIADSLKGVVLRISTTALESVLQEILENAKKFHPGHLPSISIAIKPAEDGMVLVTIADDGVTLSPERLKQVWLPYYQGEKDLTGETTGMGLGLAMVATIIREQGGRFQMVNRSPDPGVVVELRIPIMAVLDAEAA